MHNIPKYQNTRPDVIAANWKEFSRLLASSNKNPQDVIAEPVSLICF